MFFYSKISHHLEGFHNDVSYVLGVLHEQPRYEIFGQDAGVAEELLVKRVVHSWHVGQSLLLVVAKERRRTTQTAARERK